MTVLSEENALGEGNSTPPRKKFRLSMKDRSTNARRNPFGPLQEVQSTAFDSRSNINDPAWYNQAGTSRERRNSADTMLNGYLPNDSKSSPDGSDSCGASPIASLSNLGNTCFLNSVLYTLRFAPSFLHNLHHLALDLQAHSSSLKAKSSSLGRNVGAASLGVAGSGKSWSSKDLLSLGNNSVFGTGPLDVRSRVRAVTERLHDLYCNLRQNEHRDSQEPFQPDVFLHALREVNPIFEGNQQHDAHELLVCLLDTVRETCRLLASAPRPSPPPPQLPPANPPSPQLPTPTSKLWSSGVRNSWKKKKKLRQQQGKTSPSQGTAEVSGDGTTETVNGVIGGPALAGISECADGEGCESTASSSTNREGSGDESTVDNPSSRPHRSAPGYNFVTEDFEGVTVLRTTCLECEHVTERKEAFCDICVPIATDQDSDDESCTGSAGVYQSAVVTSEHLRDLNKYWCEQCLRYNEARRQVRYERLPRLLVLQLKRFSSTFGSMVCVSKVNDYMPTPLTLGCFCESCCPLAEESRPHRYRLFGVIMHLGATIASGHYVAYVRAADPSSEYRRCDRRRAASLDGSLSSASSATSGSSNSGGSSSCDKMGGILKFFRPRSSATASSSTPPPSHDGGRPCRGAECCGVRLQLPNPLADSSVPDTPWLECDDETVRVLTTAEFEAVLAPKPSKSSALTPYLLFYSRI